MTKEKHRMLTAAENIKDRQASRKNVEGVEGVEGSSSSNVNA